MNLVGIFFAIGFSCEISNDEYFSRLSHLLGLMSRFTSFQVLLLSVVSDYTGY